MWLVQFTEAKFLYYGEVSRIIQMLSIISQYHL